MNIFSGTVSAPVAHWTGPGRLGSPPPRHGRARRGLSAVRRTARQLIHQLDSHLAEKALGSLGVDRRLAHTLCQAKGAVEALNILFVGAAAAVQVRSRGGDGISFECSWRSPVKHLLSVAKMLDTADKPRLAVDLLASAILALRVEGDLQQQALLLSAALDMVDRGAGDKHARDSLRRPVEFCELMSGLRCVGPREKSLMEACLEQAHALGLSSSRDGDAELRLALKSLFGSAAPPLRSRADGAQLHFVCSKRCSAGDVLLVCETLDRHELPDLARNLVAACLPQVGLDVQLVELVNLYEVTSSRCRQRNPWADHEMAFHCGLLVETGSLRTRQRRWLAAFLKRLPAGIVDVRAWAGLRHRRLQGLLQEHALLIESGSRRGRVQALCGVLKAAAESYPRDLELAIEAMAHIRSLSPQRDIETADRWCLSQWGERLALDWAAEASAARIRLHDAGFQFKLQSIRACEPTELRWKVVSLAESRPFDVDAHGVEARVREPMGCEPVEFVAWLDLLARDATLSESLLGARLLAICGQQLVRQPDMLLQPSFSASIDALLDRGHELHNPAPKYARRANEDLISCMTGRESEPRKALMGLMKWLEGVDDDLKPWARRRLAQTWAAFGIEGAGIARSFAEVEDDERLRELLRTLLHERPIPDVNLNWGLIRLMVLFPTAPGEDAGVALRERLTIVDSIWDEGQGWLKLPDAAVTLFDEAPGCPGDALDAMRRDWHLPVAERMTCLRFHSALIGATVLNTEVGYADHDPLVDICVHLMLARAHVRRKGVSDEAWSEAACARKSLEQTRSWSASHPGRQLADILNAPVTRLTKWLRGEGYDSSESEFG